MISLGVQPGGGACWEKVRETVRIKWTGENKSHAYGDCSYKSKLNCEGLVKLLTKCRNDMIGWCVSSYSVLHSQLFSYKKRDFSCTFF